jgi:hypothetical protein
MRTSIRATAVEAALALTLDAPSNERTRRFLQFVN